MKLIQWFFATFLISQLSLATIIDLRSGEPVSMEELSSQGKIFVLGEYHYNEKIQTKTAEIINSIVSDRKSKGDFLFGWEFLNTDKRVEVLESYQDFLKGSVSSSEFLEIHLGTYEGNRSYEVILETIKDLNGDLTPLNLSRSIKRAVSQGGIEALDPQYLPSNFLMGSDEYYARFIEAMGGHGGAQIDNYFAAQSLVDNVMAETMLDSLDHSLGFLLCGAFHSDYFHGVVEELQRRSNLETIAVKLLDASSMSEEEIQRNLYHPEYGEIADFAIIVE